MTDAQWPPGIRSPDHPASSDGRSTFFGLPMMQNRNAVVAINALLEEVGPVARIIELGTGYGGLSVLLHVYCVATGAAFVTYDLNAVSLLAPLFSSLGIEQRQKDLTVFKTLLEIARLAQGEGTTLLFCDGPHKTSEVYILARYLKQGDVICAHDYAPTAAVFSRVLSGRLWSWHEIEDAAIQDEVARNELVPVLPDTMLSAAWGAWVKRGALVTP